MKNTATWIIALVAIVITVLFMVGCQTKSPSEQIAETLQSNKVDTKAINDAIENTKDITQQLDDYVKQKQQIDQESYDAQQELIDMLNGATNTP